MAFSTIDKSTLYQNQVLYTGNGGTQSITGVGFQPDFTWIKQRASPGSEAHFLFDAIRGATKRLIISTAVAEVVVSTSLTAFDSDGFSLGSNAECNQNTATIVGWNWKANGSGSANTDGSVASTVSVNTTSGFSICTWTGTGSVLTVGHGLGVVPKFMLIKRLNSTGDGVVYHESMGNAGGMEITSTGAYNAVSGWWDTTSPTSSVFTLGTNGNINASGGTYVGYCFAEISGFSKFNSYTGNASADGAFVYTGFKPSFVMIKRSDGAQQWPMTDSARSPDNEATETLYANLLNAEVSMAKDLLSNGFKCRTTDADINASGGTYVYMAFGQPIISNSGVSANAR